MGQQWSMEHRRWPWGGDVEVKVDGIRSIHSRVRAPAGHGRHTLSYICKNKWMDEQLPGTHSIHVTFWQRVINSISTHSNCYFLNYFPPLPPLCDLQLHLLLLLLRDLSPPDVSVWPLRLRLPSLPTTGSSIYIRPTICLSFPFQPFLLSGL